jgi:hypothetical protein
MSASRNRVGVIQYPNIVYAMQASNMTVADLGWQLQISQSAMTLKLQGRITLTPDEKETLAAALGYDAVWLFAPAVPVFADPAIPLKTLVRRSRKHTRRSQAAQAASYEHKPTSICIWNVQTARD